MKFPHFVNKILKEPAMRLSRKLSCNWLIMLVAMVTSKSSYVKYKNNIFTVQRKILILHQYLYNKALFIFTFYVKVNILIHPDAVVVINK